MTQFYTYLWLRDNGTPYYVGKGFGKRAYSNSGRFTKRPVDRARILVQLWESEEKSLEMEKWYIALFGRKDLGYGVLHNLTDGGEGISGLTHTMESKAKMSSAKKGKPLSEAHRARLSNAHKGRKFSEATLQIMAEVGKLRNVDHLHTPESIEKRSKTHRGFKHTPESIEKMKVAQKGKTFSEETRSRMREAWVLRKQRETTCL